MNHPVTKAANRALIENFQLNSKQLMNSMTGFGAASARIGSRQVSVEIRSVNGRYLEQSLRLPREWAEYEYPLRDVIRARITRGSVSLFVKTEEVPEDAHRMINHDFAKSLKEELTNLCRELSIDDDVRLGHLLSRAELFVPAASVEADPDTGSQLQDLVIVAIEALNAMREREGRNITQDITERVSNIVLLLSEIQDGSKGQVELQRVKLTERVRQVLNEESFDEHRIAMEIAVIAERLDITEECVRLQSHCEYLNDLLSTPEPAGRKMNFLIQEINREVNTIGSKSTDIAIARRVVGIKEEIEKIREQVQNLE